MKANKALKRLTKIEALISDVTERYSAGARHVREALHEAKATVARVKGAVRSQATYGTRRLLRHPQRRRRNPPSRDEDSVRLVERQSKKLHGGVGRKRERRLGRQIERQGKPHPPGRRPL
jgi:hypothetical protein